MPQITERDYVLGLAALLVTLTGLGVAAVITLRWHFVDRSSLALRISWGAPAVAFWFGAFATLVDWEVTYRLLWPARMPAVLMYRFLAWLIGASSTDETHDSFRVMTAVLAGAFWFGAGTLVWFTTATAWRGWKRARGTREFTVGVAPARDDALSLRPRHPVAHELVPRVREILEAHNIVSLLPPSREIVALICAPVPAGATVAEAHTTWLPEGVGKAETPRGLPRQPADARCPDGLVLVEIDCVEQRTGGMGSYFPFLGYFVSLLLLVEEGTIWDARGTMAS
jgi:hypothetical protein